MEAQNLFVNLAGLSFFDADLAWLGLLILYIGPETILPLASFFAALVGILLMFWRWLVGIFRRFLRLCSRTTARILGREWHDDEVTEATSDIEGKEGEGKGE